jgi:hypothetical protein
MSDLSKRLDTLKLVVGRISDGEFVVYSEAEPLFCFSRPTEAEVLDIARNVLTDYDKRFHRKNISVELTEAEIPRVSLRPSRTVTPRLSQERDSSNLAFAY